VTVLCALVTAYMVVLFVRAVMSWFPIRPGTGMAALVRILNDLTEPVIAPVRRIIPPAGMFDMSFLVVFLAFAILRTIVCRSSF
jgi:YggT family protein